VNIHDAVNAIVFILQFDVIIDSAKQITDVLPGSGTGTGKNTFLHSENNLVMKKSIINGVKGTRKEAVRF
jgi:hypothetical protein